MDKLLDHLYKYYMKEQTHPQTTNHQSNPQFASLKYNSGFGNHFHTQCKEGAAIQNQNNPLDHPYFPEQLSGSSFTMKRNENFKAWLYKVRPSVIQGQYKPSATSFKIVPSYIEKSHLVKITPNQLRWKSIPSAKQKINFIESLTSLMGAGEPSLKNGTSVYAYSANASMDKTAMVNADGDFLIVPHIGTLFIKTLNGLLKVNPLQIVVIPRGFLFSISVQGQIKGWVAEIFNGHLSLPQLGVIGSNGLANPAHFLYPVAWFEDKKQPWKIYNKYIGEMYECHSDYSPFDVVGWKGNYSPYKYDLTLYNTIGSISYDHPDPSIFTVLTCKSSVEGMASLDFVIFPPRWLVAEKTFRPPYYHRNCMTEFMGNICGSYDAKGKGFSPGCSSLHSTLTPHGPDAESYVKAVKGSEAPVKVMEGCMAFMFQSGFMLKTTAFAFDGFAELDTEYPECWQPLALLKIE